MALWKIAFSRHNNTEVLLLEGDAAPDVEQASNALLAHAREHFERQEADIDAQTEQTAAVQLAECYGVTITGIACSE